MSIRTQRSSARVGAAAIVAALIASLFAFVAPAGALAPTDPVVRYAGADRYDTAARAALANFTANANANIVIASGQNFPDGLAAAYLAGAVNGPLLLTAQASLPAATANALGSLAAANTTVHVVGGTAAVSANVRAQLAALGYTVNEIGGATRYETAAAVAAAANTIAGVGNFQGQRTAIVTTGENFPDALSAGPLAYEGSHPILLTTGAALSPAANAALTSLNIQRVIILGGTAAVSQAVQDAIAAKGIAVARVSGANRYATAAALANVLVSTPVEGGAGWPSPFQVTLALGTNFPDALSASQVGGVRRAPIVLTAPTALPAESQAFLAGRATGINGLFVMGGTAAIPASVLDAARTAATPVAVTATITALQGRSSFTVEFNEPVVAATVTAGDFTIASAGRVVTVGAPATLPLPGATAATQFTVPITAAVAPVNAFAVGDVVNLTAGSVTAVSGRTNAAASTTVVADTTRPTAVLLRASANHDEVWVAFSEAVTATPGAGTVGAQAANFAGVAGSNILWRATLAADAAAGQTITIPAGAFTDLAGNTNLVITGTVVTDTVRPTLATATYTATPTAQAAATVSGPAGNLTITARSTGVAAGLTGNAWSIVAGNAAAPLGVSVNTTLRQIGINGPLGAVDANALAAALNANATFTANFTATVNAGGAIDLSGANLPEAFAGGVSSVTVRAQFSESLSPLASVITNANITRQGGGNVPAGAPGLTGAITGLITYTYNAGVAGDLPQSVVLVGGEVTDLAGNTNLGQNVNVTAAS